MGGTFLVSDDKVFKFFRKGSQIVIFLRVVK